MSGSFLNASSQYIAQDAPLRTVTPFSVGCWFRVTATGVYAMWSMGATATFVGWYMYYDGADLVLSYWDGATDAGLVKVLGVTQNEWHYGLIRVVSSTNRRVSILYPTGATSHAQTTVSVVPTTLGRMTIGCFRGSGTSAFFNGQIAELWYADADIQVGGAVLADVLLHQIAYRGPFSVSHIVPQVVEYRSLRSGLETGTDVEGEIYQRGAVRPWVPSGAPTLGVHPPLYGDYVRPNQRRRLLIV